MRQRPAPSIPVLVWLAYGAVFLAVPLALGADYELAFTDADNARPWVLALVVGTALIAGVTTWLGWWDAALRERRRVGGWLRFVPLIILALILVALDYGNLPAVGGSLLMWIAAGVLLVGFCEEMLFRGLAVVGFRGGMREAGVWFWSSLGFGLFHGLNILLGQDVAPTILQIVNAFVLGTVFYVCRRVAGTIVVPMALHALWDFSSFTAADGHLLNGVATYGSLVVFIAIMVSRSRLFGPDEETIERPRIQAA